jgi:hypothetical protein
MNQAMAVRYSNCLISKHGNDFSPKGQYSGPVGTIYLKYRGKPFPVQNVTINVEKLAKKYDMLANRIGVDFVTHPLFDCDNMMVDKTGIQTVKRWLGKWSRKKGLVDPLFQQAPGEKRAGYKHIMMSGTPGSEFIKDDQKYNDIKKQQQAYINGEDESPNVADSTLWNKSAGEGVTPKEDWDKIVKADMMAGWKNAMSIIRTKMPGKAAMQGYMDGLDNEKDDLINMTYTSVLMGLSGHPRYTSEDFRITRAASLILKNIEKHVDPQLIGTSLDTKHGEEGEGSSRGGLISQTREEQPGGKPVSKHSTADEKSYGGIPVLPRRYTTALEPDIDRYLDYHFDRAQGGKATLPGYDYPMTKDQAKQAIMLRYQLSQQPQSQEEPEDTGGRWGRRFGR